MAQKDQPEIGRVVVTGSNVHQTLRDGPLRRTNLDKLINPADAAADSVRNVADRERERGHETNAVLLKAGAGALEIGGDIATDPTSWAPINAAIKVESHIAGMAVDHLNNPDMVVKHLANHAYGENKYNMEPLDYLSAEYKAFYTHMDRPTEAKTTAGAISGFIGRAVVNAAAGTEVVAEGGRMVNRFADMIHRGGSVEDYVRLEALSNKHDGLITPNDYIELKGLRGKDVQKRTDEQKKQADADMKGMERALSLGGISVQYLDSLHKGTTEQYFKDEEEFNKDNIKVKHEEAKKKKLGDATLPSSAPNMEKALADATLHADNLQGKVTSPQPVSKPPGFFARPKADDRSR